ncbi:MAG: hypothetical protein U9O06_03525 [Euryarchaeota archaeon]|nr:hypothetical protein [Euryarchaeota archaeon]
MRFKWVVEPPATLDAVDDARRAIPLVPTSEADCLRRLVDRTTETGITDSEDASEWLTFLRALGLVDRTASGYRRERVELTADELADRLRDGIYGAREIYDRLAAADEPLAVDDLDGTVDLPTWERHHHADPERVRRQRLRRLADWFVLCGIADRTAADYYK